MDNDLVQVRGQQARAMGTVLHLEGRVLDLGGKPVDGALVEIWQCDAQGIYDHPRQSGRDKRDSAFQGYGRMLVKADGRYSFRTLKPVAYAGRSPHIHFKVATATGGCSPASSMSRAIRATSATACSAASAIRASASWSR